MRFKPLPSPPADLEAVAAAQRAVPLVPGTEDDCCARLMRRREFPSRDVARTWLTFLRALDLAAETDEGFVRTDRDPTPEHLRTSFVDRVFGVRETLTVLREANDPVTATAAFARLREIVPHWERHKRRSWEDDWVARVADTLDWLVLVGLAERTADGYVASER